MTQKDKARFRASKLWKDFRKTMSIRFGRRDAITGRLLRRGFNLHHLCEKQYTDLTESNFIPLNKQTHEFLHWLYRYENYEEILEKLKYYIDEMRSLNR